METTRTDGRLGGPEGDAGLGLADWILFWLGAAFGVVFACAVLAAYLDGISA